MSNIILCNISDAKKTIDEERLHWIFDVLEALGVPDEVFDVADIRDYRYNMEEFGIEVESHSNGNIDVYKKQWYDGPNEQSGWLPAQKEHLVAQWKEPYYVRRIEGRNAYYEIHINEWSILNMK
jgi:hypothetical protein